MNLGITKGIKRNLPKDIIITVLCIAFFAALLWFILTPAGIDFFAKIQTQMPFVDLMRGTLSDIDQMVGLVFEKYGIGIESTSLKETMASTNISAIMLDLSKLLLSTFFQSVIYILFSFLFLYSKSDVSVLMALTGEDGGKADIFYTINSKLLLAISILLGGLSGNYVITLVTKAVSDKPIGVQHIVSILMFVVMYLAFSLIFMLRSMNGKGGFYNFTRSMIKTIVFNILPELMTFFVINVLLIMLFECATVLGFHILTVLVLVAVVVWAILSKLLGDLMVMLFTLDLPYLGKYCPISGIFWCLGTATVVSFEYLMAVPNTTDDFLGETLSALPFFSEWMSGISPFTAVMYSFDRYALDLLNLFIICFVIAILQYLSSSYTATLFMQIVVRIGIFLGIGLVIMSFGYMILYYGAPVLFASISKAYLAIVIAAILFAILAAFQPYLIIQSICSSVVIMTAMHFIPCTFRGAESYNDLTKYFIAFFILLGVDALAALLQNVVAVFEKKANLVKKAAKVATALK